VVAAKLAEDQDQKTSGTAMASPAALAETNSLKDFDWLTYARGNIERQRIFRLVANRLRLSAVKWDVWKLSPCEKRGSLRASAKELGWREPP
jgi:hypothetical protein